jgi:hypothetical protein
MKRIESDLFTPIFLKQSDQDSWPEEPVFYLLTGSGLFLCRNHSFYRSAVPVRRWPTELAAQESLLEISYPLIPQALLELAVGFFDEAYKERGAESIVLLAYDRSRQVVELVVPNQTAYSYRTASGTTYPESVRYLDPDNLPRDWHVFGDIHSHCDMAAYASTVDQNDEQYFSGLHLVVGRLDDEPPQFYAEASVDGGRFKVRTEQVVEGYTRRSLDFPRHWLDRLTVEYHGPATTSTSYPAANGTYYAAPNYLAPGTAPLPGERSRGAHDNDLPQDDDHGSRC